MTSIDIAKRAAAVAAAELVQAGMRIGLGTGSTAAHLLPALAARALPGIRCVATSAETERTALALGLAVEPFDRLDRLDLAVDGADQVAPGFALIKGGGGAHVREKIVATAAERFVVIADASKVVTALHAPLPLELLAFGLPATLAAVGELGPVTVRAGVPPSPDGGVICDLDAAASPALAAALDAIPGVTGHGWFAPELVADVLIGARDGTVRALARV